MTNREYAVLKIKEIHEAIGSILITTNIKSFKKKRFRTTLRIFRDFIKTNMCIETLNADATLSKENLKSLIDLEKGDKQ